MAGHHVRYNRRGARRLDVVGDEDTNAGYLTYLAIQHSIRLGCGDKARVLKQQTFHPRRHDDKASPGWKVDLVHEYGEVDELLIDVRRGELRRLDGVIRCRGRGTRVEGSYVGVSILGELVGRTVGCSVDEFGAHLRGVDVVNFEGEVLGLVDEQRDPGIGELLIGDGGRILG